MRSNDRPAPSHGVAIADSARLSWRDQVSAPVSAQPPQSAPTAPTAPPASRAHDEQMESGSLFTIVAEACQDANAANASNVEGLDGAEAWQVEPARHTGDIWIHVTHRRAVTPEQADQAGRHRDPA